MFHVQIANSNMGVNTSKLLLTFIDEDTDYVCDASFSPNDLEIIFVVGTLLKYGMP